MSNVIKDGAGGGSSVKVTSDNRLLTDSLVEPISSERSRKGQLYGIGTGGLTASASMSLGSVLWLKNVSPTDDIYVQKIIFGWNGGSTNFNRTIFSLIFYNTSAPTANHTSITDQIENIALSGSSVPVSSGVVTAYKWDGVSTGMTSGSGGFAQIPNRLSQGNHSIDIDGEIILGAGNTMEFRVSPEETGLFHVSVVFYLAPKGLGRSFI